MSVINGLIATNLEERYYGSSLSQVAIECRGEVPLIVESWVVVTNPTIASDNVTPL